MAEVCTEYLVLLSKVSSTPITKQKRRCSVLLAHQSKYEDYRYKARTRPISVIANLQELLKVEPAATVVEVVVMMGASGSYKFRFDVLVLPYIRIVFHLEWLS